jgi:hypothetical protein
VVNNAQTVSAKGIGFATASEAEVAESFADESKFTRGDLRMGLSFRPEAFKLQFHVGNGRQEWQEPVTQVTDLFGEPRRSGFPSGARFVIRALWASFESF